MRSPRHALLAASVVLTFQAGCAILAPPAVVEEQPPAAPDPQVYHRAETGRSQLLAREVKRLRADLDAAEEALIAAESGLRGNRTRADAVSALAEGHIEVDRAREQAPWLYSETDEASEKLAEAERQIEAGNFGAAIFFTWRAERLAERSIEESSLATSTPGVRTIRSKRVNLREGPSTDDEVLTVLTRGMPVFPEQQREDWILVRTTRGDVGWVHQSLVH